MGWQASQRTEEIKYAIRDIMLLANEVKATGKEMLYLNVGDPVVYDFDVPQHLKEAVRKAVLDGCNSYAPSSGIPEALEAIRGYAHKVGIKNVCDVFTSYGASEAIEICLAALTDPKDNVIIPSPGYPLYSALNGKLGIESRYYALDESNNWEPNVEDIEQKIDKNTKAIVLINPNNPTGTVYSKGVLQKIIEIADKHKLIIFSDEIYDQIVYEGEKHIPTASLTEDVPVVTFNGLSKCYFAPGWRVGWAIISGPQKQLQNYIAGAQKMTRARLCSVHPWQYAIKPALEEPNEYLDEKRATLQARRDLVYRRFNEIEGISCVKPGGSFYAFPKIERDIKDETFVTDLVKKTGIVVVHGSGFGELAGSGHFRVVFLPPEDVLQKATDRIEEFMKANF